MELLIAMATQGGDGGGMTTFIMLGLMFVVMYFMMIRPQQKRAKEHQKMLSEIQKGDKIITSGGMHGTIAGLEDKTVLLDLGGQVKVKIERSAIATVVSKE